jgi:hypothetical protein
LTQGLKNTRITHLKLGNNRLTDAHAADLVTILTQTRIKSLSLNHNQLSDTGAQILGKGLADTRIETLDINDNLMTPWGQQHLAEQIVHHQAVLVNTPILLMQFRTLLEGERNKIFNTRSSPLAESEQQIYNGVSILSDPRLPNELFCNIMSYLPAMKFETNQKINECENQAQILNAINRNNLSNQISVPSIGYPLKKLGGK